MKIQNKRVMKYYAAGGAVRDLLLGRTPRDTDYVFDDTEQAFIQRNPTARKIQSSAHPIFLLCGQEYSPLPESASREESIRLDLLRRDFSVNALLLSPEGVLHAHDKALSDLKSRIIRPASPTALRDDPVRAFRAARFAATLPGFAPHRETFEAMRALSAAELERIAAEQVGKELLKACAGDAPGAFLRMLCQGNCLWPWFAEFSNADAIPAGPPAYHSSSVLEHTAQVMDTVAQSYAETDGRERALAVWMALCHDIGKTATAPDILPSHHGHEQRGEAMALALGARLRLPSLFVKAGGLASSLHMKAVQYQNLRPGTRVDLLLPLHAAGLLGPFARAAAADSRNPELPEILTRDLAVLLAVRLPDVWRNRDAASGEKLRELRCMALHAASPRKAVARV